MIVVNSWNPNRVDPTRTTMIRRTFLADLRRRFKRLRQAVRQLVHKDDAFGLIENVGESVSVGADRPRDAALLRGSTPRPIANAGRFSFMSDHDAVKAFMRWMKKQLASELVGRDENELWKKYIEQGFAKGAGRSFDDVKRSALRKERPDLFAPGEENRLKDFYEGSKSEFLRSAFGRPVGVEKVKQLASRTFEDIEGVSDSVARRIRRTLVDGMVRGEHSRDIAKTLAEDLDWGEYRAERVARTEVSRAYVEGQLDALELMGVEELGVMVEWSTAGDSHVCPQCRPLEDKVFKIEDARGLFPIHPQCRCALIPSLKQNRVDNRLHPTTNAAVRISREQLLEIVANIRREAALNCGGKGGKPGPCPTGRGGKGSRQKVDKGVRVPNPIPLTPPNLENEIEDELAKDRADEPLKEYLKYAATEESVPISSLTSPQRVNDPDNVQYFNRQPREDRTR